MKGRLYRFTPAGGKPEHFTHDFRSATRGLCQEDVELLGQLRVGEPLHMKGGANWERVA